MGAPARRLGAGAHLRAGGPGAPFPHSRRPQPARRAEPGSGAHSAEWETEAPTSLRARREGPGPRLAAAPGLEVKARNASRGPKSWRKSHFAITLVSQRGRSPRGIRDRPQDSAGRERVQGRVGGALPAPRSACSAAACGSRGQTWSSVSRGLRRGERCSAGAQTRLPPTCFT